MSCILGAAVRGSGIFSFGTSVALALVFAAHGAAQTPADEQARELFRRGAEAFDAQRYEEALDYFQRSYEISGRDELLNNIGSAQERLGQNAAAIRSYERFIQTVPDSPNRGFAERRLRRLRESGGAQQAGAAENAASVPLRGAQAAAAPDPGPIPWIAGGASIAVAAVGAILVGVAVSDVSAIDNAPQDSRWADYEERYARTEAMSIAGFVMLGVGGAGLAASLFWLIAGPSIGGSARIDVHLGPDIAAFSLRGAL